VRSRGAACVLVNSVVQRCAPESTFVRADAVPSIPADTVAVGAPPGSSAMWPMVIIASQQPCCAADGQHARYSSRLDGARVGLFQRLSAMGRLASRELAEGLEGHRACPRLSAEPVADHASPRGDVGPAKFAFMRRPESGACQETLSTGDLREGQRPCLIVRLVVKGGILGVARPIAGPDASVYPSLGLSRPVSCEGSPGASCNVLLVD
jgi:hypothetical protein